VCRFSFLGCCHNSTSCRTHVLALLWFVQVLLTYALVCATFLVERGYRLRFKQTQLPASVAAMQGHVYMLPWWLEVPQVRAQRSACQRWLLRGSTLLAAAVVYQGCGRPQHALGCILALAYALRLSVVERCSKISRNSSSSGSHRPRMAPRRQLSLSAAAVMLMQQMLAWIMMTLRLADCCILVGVWLILAGLWAQTSKLG
jgi:hypothetical protein